MMWPSAEVETGVMATIAQFYAILLSTLSSVNRQQLSLFDANYALVVSSSPFAIYLVLSSIRSLLGFDTNLFKRVKSYPRVIRFFGALLLPLWLGLRLTLRLSTKAFKDSELCENPTFKDMSLDLLLLFSPLAGPAGGAWVFLVLLIMLSSMTMIAVALGMYRSYPEKSSDLWELPWSQWAFVIECGKCVSVLVDGRST